MILLPEIVAMHRSAIVLLPARIHVWALPSRTLAEIVSVFEQVKTPVHWDHEPIVTNSCYICNMDLSTYRRRFMERVRV
ncbi:MAG: hypothetical protein DME26_16710 [Verrucomicrobia bacterium]|nr:MAG: hypothetical protein DME26_16710 [Verrucomicrobiota bacterium]